jgi:hypothetical protein
MFKISYVLPGRMSAGMTTELSMSFNPPNDFDQDISSEIICKAESGGAFKIPFGCRKRKCSPYIVGASANSIELDFGSIVVGSKDTRTFVLKNHGALKTDFEILLSEGEAFTANKEVGNVSSKEAVKIEITFAPTLISTSLSSQLVIKFAEDAEPLYVNCTGNSIASPLALRETHVDFGICDFHSQDHGRDILLINTAGQSIKFKVACTSTTIPTAIQAGSIVCKLPNGIGYLKIHKSAIIQGSGTFPIRIQFKPKENASKSLADFEVPLSINYTASGVACKIDFRVSGSITNASVSFEFKNNFKVSCSLYEQIELPIVITNHSHLPQTLKPYWNCKVFSLRALLTDEIAGDTLNIEPQQRTELCIVFKPEDIKQYELALQLKTERGKIYKFKGTGLGYRPQVRFNSNMLNFPPTSLGSMNNMKVTLIHKEPPNEKPDYYPWIKKERTPDSGNHGEIKYEFLSPSIELVGNSSDGSDSDYSYTLTDLLPVMVSPSNGTFTRSSSSVIDFIVSPSLFLAGVKNEIELRVNQIETDRKSAIETAETETRLEQENLEKEAAAAIAAAPKKKGANPTKAAEPVAAPVVLPIFKPIPPMNFFADFKECTAYVTIPCKITSGKTNAKRNSDFINGESVDSSKNEKVEELTQVRLVFDIVSPDFIIESWPSDSPTEDKTDSLLHGSLLFSMVSLHLLTFLKVPIGQCLYKSISIRNAKNHTITLKSSMLNPQGPFYLARSLRPINANGSYELRLSFEPRIAGKYQTTLDIMCGATSSTINLVGEAVIPQIDIQADAATVLDFPQLLLGDEAMIPIQITNPCHFPITVNAKAEQSGQFEISPQSSVILPHQEQTLSVKFCPMEEDSSIRDFMSLSYWGMKQEENIDLKAKGWSTGAVLSGYDAHMSKDDVSSVIQANQVCPDVSLVEDNNRFIECKCTWQAIDDEGGETAYVMEPKCLEILNLKPDVLKMENVGKNIKALAVQYTIEKIQFINLESTEFYIDLDLLSGSVDHGSKKSIGIKLSSLAALADSGASKKSKKSSETQVLSTPVKLNLVSYFRISLKGGYQSTEPKGIAEQKDWVLKVTVE